MLNHNREHIYKSELNNSNIKLSIVVPVYNEDKSIEILIENIRSVCKKLDSGYEILIIDDGSNDKTPFVLKKIIENTSNVKTIRFSRNYGQTAAMAAGFAHAKGNVIISMDGDLQNDPEDIPLLIEKINEGYDIVCGWRKDRKDKLITRRIPSIVANKLIKFLTGIKIHDNGCSLKAYRSSVIKKVHLYSEMHRFIPAMASISGASITEIVVKHHPRKYGNTKYGMSRIWKVFLDLFVLKMLVGFSSRPLIWFGILSVPFILLGLFFLLVSLSYYWLPMHGDDTYIIFTSISFLFFFLVVQLNSFGIFSELVIRTGISGEENFSLLE
jgi:glycosyltransferase involved in cell wall biosynthesis